MGVKSNHQYRPSWNNTRVYKTSVSLLRHWKDAGNIRAPDLAQHSAVFQLDMKHDTRSLWTQFTQRLFFCFPDDVNAGYSRCRPKRAGINPVLPKTAQPIHIYLLLVAFQSYRTATSPQISSVFTLYDQNNLFSDCCTVLGIQATKNTILPLLTFKCRCIRNISELQPTRCNVSWFIYFHRCSTCFRWFLRSS